MCVRIKLIMMTIPELQYINTGKQSRHVLPLTHYSCPVSIYCPSQGIACDVTSEGHKHLHAATAEVLGESKPYSICGSLPLVGDLQEAGFDVQVRAYKYCIVYL